MTKKKFKNSLLLFLFGIITLSCSLENEAVHQHEHSKKASYQRKMYDELILDKNFSKAIKQIPKKNVLASTSLNRTVMEEQYGFTIFDVPINVMETDSVISYNLCIETDSLTKGDFFENLVINSNKFTNTIDAYLVKYNLLSEITPSAHGSFSFDFEPEIKPINYDASTARAFTWCYSYHYEMCHELVPGTQFESPHTPTEACNQQSLIYTHTETRCIVIGEPGGTGDSGAFEGSNSNGQSSYGNNTVIINPNPNQGPTPSELKRIREQCFLNTFLSTAQSNWIKAPANAQTRNAIYDFLATQTNYQSGDDFACYPNEAMEFAEELIDLAILEPNQDDVYKITKLSIMFETSEDIFSEEFGQSLLPFTEINPSHIPPDYPITNLTISTFLKYKQLRQLNPDWSRAKCLWYATKEMVHIGLDVFGMCPLFGEPADVLNGVLYTIEGDGLNATLSYAGAVPLTGWAATGVKYAIKINEVSTLGSKVKLVWKVAAGGVIQFGSRGQLRKVLGLLPGNPLQAHHIIPWNKQSKEIVQKAAKSGNAFHMNEALNGIPLSTAAHNGSHANYDNVIQIKFNQFKLSNPDATPDECYNFLVDLINDIRTWILNNPNVPINNIVLP